MRASPGRGRSVTRLGWWALAGAGTLVSLALLRGDVWLYLVAAVALSAVLVSWVAAPRLSDVDLRLTRPALERAGRDSTYDLTVTATRPVPLHHMTLELEGADPVQLVVGPLVAGESSVASVTVSGGVRGTHRGALVHDWTSAPFGLVRVDRSAEFTVVRTVAVTPDPAHVAAGSVAGDGNGRVVRVSRAGSDVHALRAWNSGDGTAIHWRATARRGTPVVADREVTERTVLVVLVGPAGEERGLDAVVARAAGIAMTAASEGVDVTLVDAGRDLRVTTADRDAVDRWTAAARPVALQSEVIDRAARLAGPGGRIAIVRGAPLASSPRALEEVAARTGVSVVMVDVDAPGAAPTMPAPAPAEPSPRLRAATMASLVSGLVGLAVAGVVSWPIALLWGAAQVGVGLLGLRRSTLLDDARVRTGLTLAICVVTALLAVGQANAGALPDAVATALAGLAVAQTLAQRTRRDSLVGLGLGPVMVVAAAGLAPTPALVLPVVATSIAALLGLAAASADSLNDGVPPGHSAAGTARPLGTLAVAVTAVVAIALTAFLVLPLGSAPTLGTSLLSTASTDPTESEIQAITPPTFIGGSLDLASRGHLSDDPVWQVRAGGPTLWRATTLDTVRGGHWQSSEPVGRQLLPGADGRIALVPDRSEAGAPRVDAREYEVRPVGYGADSSIIGPGPVTAVRGPDAVVQVWPDFTFAMGDARSYVVTSDARTTLDSLTASGRGSDQTSSRWTQLDGTPDRVQALAASLTVGVVDRVAQVRAVQDYLRSTLRYTLDAPQPPQGQDPVDYLLFDSHEGFCQHFAAAEVTLLRSVGIPSRMATGYAFGEEVDGSGWATAKASDAHAWVEVWIEGHGWVTSDPTAGSQLAGPTDPSFSQRLAAAWTSLWSTDASRRATAVVVLLIALLIVGTVVTLRRRPRPSPGGGAATASRAAEPLLAFGRLRAALRSHGHPLTPGDGVTEVRRLVPTALASALDVVERSLYDRVPVPAQQRLAAAEELDHHTAALLAQAAALASH